MTLTTVQRPAFTVVGMQIRTSPMSPGIPALWPKFVARIDEIAHPAYPLSQIGAGFGEIYEKLLPSSPYRQAPGAFFERYDEAFDPANPQSTVEIHIPIMPR